MASTPLFASSWCEGVLADADESGAESEVLRLLSTLSPSPPPPPATSFVSACLVCRARPALFRSPAAAARLLALLRGASPAADASSAAALAASLVARAFRGARLPDAVAAAFLDDSLGARAWVDLPACGALVRAAAAPGALDAEAVAARLDEAEERREAQPRAVPRTLAALAALEPCRRLAARRLTQWLSNPSSARAARALMGEVAGRVRAGEDAPETARALLAALRPGTYEGSYDHYARLADAFPREAAEHYLEGGGADGALPRAAHAAHDARLLALMRPRGALLAEALAARPPRCDDRARRLLQQAGPEEAEAFCLALLRACSGADQAGGVAALVACAQLCHADAASAEWRAAAARVQEKAVVWMRANALAGQGGSPEAFWGGVSACVLRGATGEADAGAAASWRILAGAGSGGTGPGGLAGTRADLVALAPDPARVDEAGRAALPVRENTLAHLLLAGIENPRLSPADVVRAAEWMVLRAAAATGTDAAGGLAASGASTVEGLWLLASRGSPRAGDATTAPSGLFWRAALLAAVLAAHNPGAPARRAWGMPSVRCLLGLLAQGRGGDPRALLPPRTADEIRASLRAERELLGAELDAAGVRVVDHSDETAARPVPAAVLDRLWQLDAELRLGARVRRMRDPAVMAALVDAGATAWLVPAALADPGCVAFLPLPAVCRLLLSALAGVPAACAPPRFLGRHGPPPLAPPPAAGAREARLAGTAAEALRALRCGEERARAALELLRPLAGGGGEPDGGEWNAALAALWLWLAPGAPRAEDLGRDAGEAGHPLWPLVAREVAASEEAAAAAARAQARVAARSAHSPSVAAALAALCAGGGDVAAAVLAQPLVFRQALSAELLAAVLPRVSENAAAREAVAAAAAVRGLDEERGASVIAAAAARAEAAAAAADATARAASDMLAAARRGARALSERGREPAAAPKRRRTDGAQGTVAATVLRALDGDGCADLLQEALSRLADGEALEESHELVAALGARPRWALPVLAAARLPRLAAAVEDAARRGGRAARPELDALQAVRERFTA